MSVVHWALGTGEGGMQMCRGSAWQWSSPPSNHPAIHQPPAHPPPCTWPVPGLTASHPPAHPSTWTKVHLAAVDYGPTLLGLHWGSSYLHCLPSRWSGGVWTGGRPPLPQRWTAGPTKRCSSTATCHRGLTFSVWLHQCRHRTGRRGHLGPPGCD